ncbi:neprosin family prolyl endopeptidase [Paraburkholderia sp. CNPSo 3281]|nr:neprosin family prolyl endopeptidase [Paraburkholderia sp. CNPSo 3281]MCP3721442.1 neprosin family prolyl endopeptidase [Paraburkholderia sp. CNPSo 3281]
MQNVENLGGNVTFNVRNPKVDAAAGQYFSLSQIWILGGDRACGANPLQSEETGWVVSPSMFADNLPHFFIYSTADNYANTGCRNNSRGDFVQISEKAVLGGALVDVSFPGGQQHEFSAEIVATHTGTGGSFVTASRLVTTPRSSIKADRTVITRRRLGLEQKQLGLRLGQARVVVIGRVNYMAMQLISATSTTTRPGMIRTCGDNRVATTRPGHSATEMAVIFPPITTIRVGGPDTPSLVARAEHSADEDGIERAISIVL